jgi:hypothetical protein
LVLAVLFLGACSSFPPAVTRKQDLDSNLRHFHVSLLSQDLPSLTRCLPASEREKWNQAFACYFHRFRVLDFVIDDVRFDKEAREARATVTVTTQALNRLATQQTTWQERWHYDDKKKWRLDTGTESLVSILEACSAGP